MACGGIVELLNESLLEIRAVEVLVQAFLELCDYDLEPQVRLGRRRQEDGGIEAGAGRPALASLAVRIHACERHSLT